MNKSCGSCQNLVRIHVMGGDAPIYWCNSAETKGLTHPIGYVHRDAPSCPFYSVLPPDFEASAGMGIKPRSPETEVERRTFENKIIVGFCLLMMKLGRIPTLMHHGEQAVLAVSSFVRTCRGIITAL